MAMPKESKTSKVVTRFAPSPTGNPHIGNIRSALFNYLFAKHNDGKFYVRIEDTDQKRFLKASEKYIFESLDWLGINDDGGFHQSERLKLYQEKVNELLKMGVVYKCFCDYKRLEKLKATQIKEKIAPRYDRRCLNLTPGRVKELEKDAVPFVIRFKVPANIGISWKDLIRDKVSIQSNKIDDFILLKSDGWPTYHLANVIDDHAMVITHVIRGEEWIPSTPKHLLLYEAFGWKHPEFAHVPLILGADKVKLSKRHGGAGILDYKRAGYLPEAMINFLALLGWNPGTTDEFFTMDELIKKLDITRVQNAPAVFDIEKLNWFNSHYIRRMGDKELAEVIKKDYPEAPITKLPNFERIVAVEKTRLTTLADITEGTDYFAKLLKYDVKMLVFKKSTKETTEKGLKAALEALESISDKDWEKTNVEGFENALKKVVEETDLSNGDIFWPVRVALSGLEKSPSPAELLWVFGKDGSIKRIQKAISSLTQGAFLEL